MFQGNTQYKQNRSNDDIPLRQTPVLKYIHNLLQSHGTMQVKIKNHRTRKFVYFHAGQGSTLIFSSTWQ